MHDAIWSGTDAADDESELVPGVAHTEQCLAMQCGLGLGLAFHVQGVRPERSQLPAAWVGAERARIGGALTGQSCVRQRPGAGWG